MMAMSDASAHTRITLLSFRTFGDYVLKAPFLYELFRKYPNARITVVTNRKGAQVYPLLDSRLQVVAADHGDSKLRLLTRMLRIPRADLAFCLDDSRTTLLLSFLVRSRQKTGWVQGISRLYGEQGYFEWKSVQPWLSRLMRFVLRPGRVRLPEDAHEAEVELNLLDETPDPGRSLASYRSRFALPPAKRSKAPYIYCAAEAGWIARQLTYEQWSGILAALLLAFPDHVLLVHGKEFWSKDLWSQPEERTRKPGGRVSPYDGDSIQKLFETISGADLVIAPDSFALHLASLYDVPAIGYFGPAHPHRFRPTGPGSSSLFRSPDCSPCLQRRGSELCAKRLSQCISLAQLTPDDFVEAARFAMAPRIPGLPAYADRSPHA